MLRGDKGQKEGQQKQNEKESGELCNYVRERKEGIKFRAKQR